MKFFAYAARPALCALLFSLGIPQPGLAQQLTLTPFKPGGIYELGERAGWTVSAPAELAKSAASYTYTIKKNNFDVIQHGTLNLSQPATIEATLDEPAMLYVEVKSS